MEDERFDMLLELLIKSVEKHGHGDQPITISHLINMMKTVHERAEREEDQYFDPFWD